MEFTSAPEVNVGTEPIKCKRKAIKERSWVWSHFSKFIDTNGVSKVKCNYCTTIYKHDSNNSGTSTLKSHYRRCKSNPSRKETGLNQSLLNLQPISEEEIKLCKWSFDYDLIRKSLAKMIIVDELPFKSIEGQGFKLFCSQMQPRFKIPSRTTIARDCYELFVAERLKLKSLLKTNCQRVCFTTDTWTSIQRINYMCLTAHFIDDNWQLNKRILNFCPISSHRGEAIGKAIEKCLLSWGIENVMTITVDNASSNDIAIGYLRKKIVNWKGAVLNGEFLHVRCTAHIMNLVVSDGLKLASKSVNRVRNAVRFIRQSPSRIEKFKKCVEDEKIESKSLLCLDVPTRWNSTYAMLETAQKFQGAFDRYGESDPHYVLDLEAGEGKPSDDDWEKVKVLSKMLESFYHLTLNVSGTHYATSNLLFQEISNVDCHLKEWIKGDNFDLSIMAVKMKEKYDKYWSDPKKINPLMFVATMLDPRYKLEYLEFAMGEMYEIDVASTLITKLRKTIIDLFDDYKKIYNGYSSGGTNHSSSIPTCQTELDMPSDSTTKLDSVLIKRFKKHKAGQMAVEQKSELDKFLEEECVDEDDDKFDIIGWWRNNSSRFPILSLIARDVLAIPVSTVASESTFSTGGRVLDPFRSSLSPKIVEALICTQDWLRASPFQVSMEEKLDEMENLEKELEKFSLAPSLVDIHG